MKQVNKYIGTALLVLLISLSLTFIGLSAVPSLINSSLEIAEDNKPILKSESEPKYLQNIRIDLFLNETSEKLKTVYIDKTIDTNALATVEQLWDELTEPFYYNTVFNYVNDEEVNNNSLYTVVVTLNYSQTQRAGFNYRADGDLNVWSLGDGIEMTRCFLGSKNIAEYINYLLGTYN